MSACDQLEDLRQLLVPLGVLIDLDGVNRSVADRTDVHEGIGARLHPVACRRDELEVEFGVGLCSLLSLSLLECFVDDLMRVADVLGLWGGDGDDGLLFLDVAEACVVHVLRREVLDVRHHCRLEFPYVLAALECVLEYATGLVDHDARGAQTRLIVTPHLIPLHDSGSCVPLEINGTTVIEIAVFVPYRGHGAMLWWIQESLGHQQVGLTDIPSGTVRLVQNQGGEALVVGSGRTNRMTADVLNST